MSLAQTQELQKHEGWEQLRKKSNKFASGLTIAIIVALDQTQTAHLPKLCVDIRAFTLALKQNRIIL